MNAAHPAVSRREAARRGTLDVLPIVLGVLPFGLIVGATAVDVGLGVSEAVGFSTIVFAGAAQLAAIDLIGRDAPVAVAIGTALVINLRMLMYGASIAPHLAHVPLPRRAGAAYLLTDQAYALSIARYQTGMAPDRRLPYYLGAAVPLWLGWQAVTVVGALGGGAIPEEVPLEFAVPLTFLVLLLPAVSDRPTLTAAVVAATVAVVAAPLPANLGMPLGAGAGIAAGYAAARWKAPG